MKSLLISAVIAVVLGVIGWATLYPARVEVSADERPMDSQLAHEPMSAPRTAELLGRLAALEAENKELWDRLRALERRPTPSLRAPLGANAASAEELGALREEVLDALARLEQQTFGWSRGREPEIEPPIARAPPGPRELEAFREHVEEAILGIRRQQADGFFRMLESKTAELDDTLVDLEERLGLTPRQSEQMRSALLARYDREADVLRRWQAGEDAEVIGSLKENDHEVHRAELAAFLSAEQQEAYRPYE